MQKIYIAALLILLAFTSLLVLLTRGQPVLVRKKIMLGLLFISLTAPAATVVSCRTGSAVNNEIWLKEGWIDNSTYRILATGKAEKRFSSIDLKKASAKRNAVINAQYQMLERFKPPTKAACADYEMPDYQVIREINVLVKSGTVKSERYNADYSCEIVYEVKAAGFKQKVQNTYR